MYLLADFCVYPFHVLSHIYKSKGGSGEIPNLQLVSKEKIRQIPHTYNPSYLGSRDQEDSGSKPAQAKSW
jgi:hypothetical protein